MEFKCKKAGNECYGFKELILLFEISLRLIQSKELKDDLSAILEMVVKYLGAERSFLTIFNRESENIIIEAAYGYSYAQQSRGKYKLGEGIIGRVVEMARPGVVDKISKSSLFLNRTGQEITKEGQKLTFICNPIIEDGKVTGTLSIIRVYNPHILYEEVNKLLTIIGSMISRSVRNKHERLEEMEILRQKNLQLQNKIESDFRPGNIVGNSSKMRDVYSLVGMVAETNSTVLIRGESGIGKELIADAIHFSSPRTKKNFIKVNCSALPETLIESELFGHQKGRLPERRRNEKGALNLPMVAQFF
jgi:Nif-specific regulatory protein